MKRIAAWLGSHWEQIAAFSSVAVAIISAYVAFASLDATRRQQAAESHHRELLIQPNLQLIPEPRSLRLNIYNAGLGPAVIRRVIAQFGDICIDSNNMDAGQWTRQTAGHQAKFEDFIFSGIIGEIKKSDPYAIADVGIPNLGEIVPSTRGRPIIGIRSVQREANSQSIPPYETLLNVTTAFGNQISRTKMQIEYCSMTGRFCSKILARDPSC